MKSPFPHRKHHENARRTEEDVREVVLDDAEARRFDLEGLVPFTRYSVSVQVINPEGVGPTATCTVSTDEGGEWVGSASFIAFTVPQLLSTDLPAEC